MFFVTDADREVAREGDSDSDKEKERREDEEPPPPPEETKIEVEIPRIKYVYQSFCLPQSKAYHWFHLAQASALPPFPAPFRCDLGRELHFVKLPNFLSVETRPYDPAFYEDEIDEDEVLDEEGRARLKLKVENTIRWRRVTQHKISRWTT